MSLKLDTSAGKKVIWPAVQPRLQLVQNRVMQLFPFLAAGLAAQPRGLQAQPKGLTPALRSPPAGTPSLELVGPQSRCAPCGAVLGSWLRTSLSARSPASRCSAVSKCVRGAAPAGSVPRAGNTGLSIRCTCRDASAELSIQLRVKDYLLLKALPQQAKLLSGSEPSYKVVLGSTLCG